jgi:hypothetical protein
MLRRAACPWTFHYCVAPFPLSVQVRLPLLVVVQGEFYRVGDIRSYCTFVVFVVWLWLGWFVGRERDGRETGSWSAGGGVPTICCPIALRCRCRDKLHKVEFLKHVWVLIFFVNKKMVYLFFLAS